MALAGGAEQASAQEGTDIELLISKQRVLVMPGFEMQRLRRVLAVLEKP